MTGFTLVVHLNGAEHTVTAERRGPAFVVLSDSGSAAARSLHRAIKIAAEIAGPYLERARSSGAAWGLYVAAGDAQARFGTWPPTVGPQIAAPRSNPSSPVARIHDHWMRRDGTPLGALDAAVKIIEIYSARGQREAA